MPSTPPPSPELTADERAVLARVDGQTPIDELAAATGLSPERVAQVVADLAARGEIEFRRAATGNEQPRSTEPPPDDAPFDASGDALAPLAHDVGDDDVPPDATADDADTDVPDADAADAPPDDAVHDPDAEAEQDRAAASSDATFRELYETRWHPRSPDARAEAARRVHGDDLAALCFDPDPRVIAALLENATAGLAHARLIAAHHRTATGLELLSRRGEWAHDALVERRLVRNPQAGGVVLGRVITRRRLLATWQLAVDRDLPEANRLEARRALRSKFHRAQPADRAELVLRTEGRCLALLAGCTFDSRTTQLLARRPVVSVLLVQNLAKFSATPPALLAHLLRQPMVRRNAALRRALQQHPNTPGELKRG